MRRLAPFVALATLASCSTAPQPTMRTAQNQMKYERLVAGKVAGKPMSCVPTLAANDMQVIDDNTLVFRQTPNNIYIASTNGCNGITTGMNTLVTKQIGGMGVCQGDIAQVVDVNRMPVGSCVFGPIVPYKRA